MTQENAVLSKSRVAIVTGGSRGFGRNVVIHLAKRGANSIFTYNSNRAEADKVVAAVSDVVRKIFSVLSARLRDGSSTCLIGSVIARLG
jgi:NAD(P)-dependent dehydrogenase (short-subunit alcohol dehydrogenase family)